MTVHKRGTWGVYYFVPHYLFESSEGKRCFSCTFLGWKECLKEEYCWVKRFFKNRLMNLILTRVLFQVRFRVTESSVSIKLVSTRYKRKTQAYPPDSFTNLNWIWRRWPSLVLAMPLPAISHGWSGAWSPRCQFYRSRLGGSERPGALHEEDQLHR